MKKVIFILMFLLNIIMIKADLNTRDELVVGMELEFPPFETKDKDGNPKGISVEMAKLISERVGMELRIENISYSNLVPSLISGRIDMIISSMTINESRGKKVDFSIPYAKSPLIMLVRKESNIENYMELANPKISIAVQEGTISQLWIAENSPATRVRIFQTEEQAVLDMIAGNSAAYINDAYIVMEKHKKYINDTRVIREPLPKVRGWGMAVHKGDEELLEEVNAFIRESKEDGTFKRLREKYLKEESEKYERETGMEYFF